jgi:hypothetical protein
MEFGENSSFCLPIAQLLTDKLKLGGIPLTGDVV